MRDVEFRVGSLSDLRDFPQTVMREAEHQLDKIQHGLESDDFKPMPTIGAGVMELRIWDEVGTGEGDFKMTDKQRFNSVWDAIEDTPQQAACMRARSELMMRLSEVIRGRGMNQGDAAELFGVTQPRISDLMRGKINLFSLDTLIDMAATAGMSPTVKVTMPKVKPRKRVKRELEAV